MRIVCPFPREFFSNTFSPLQVPLLIWDKNAERWLGGERVLPSLEMRQLYAVAEEMNFSRDATSCTVVNRR